MRCPQCGFDSTPQAAFCSRCGARMTEPKPATVREYAIVIIRRSPWFYARSLIAGGFLTIVGITLVFKGPQTGNLGLLAIVLGLLFWASVPLVHRSVSWQVTSDRLIEQRGLLATRRREVELSDIRSIEVARRLGQRLTGLGDVIVASAASVDYVIRITDVYDPEGVAETVRKARLKRLA